MVLLLKMSHVETPVGKMVALADSHSLHLLEFECQEGLKRIQTHFQITQGRNSVIDAIDRELKEYFSGNLTEFKTPVSYIGSPFQEEVWAALRTIPYGKTISYRELASVVGRPKSCRAVGSANGANRLAIVIPCHRVINAGGNLGGYAGSKERKAWLLQHEI